MLNIKMTGKISVFNNSNHFSPFNIVLETVCFFHEINQKITCKVELPSQAALTFD